MKLYFVGAHSTGKTTLARYASTTYKLPLIAETARTELAKMERRFDELRVDVAATTSYQFAVFRAQLRAEHGLGALDYALNAYMGIRKMQTPYPCKS